MQRFWKDYSYSGGRARPVGVTRCQLCHDRHAAIIARHAANGGAVTGYSVKLRPSERARCSCGATQRKPAGGNDWCGPCEEQDAAEVLAALRDTPWT